MRIFDIIKNILSSKKEVAVEEPTKCSCSHCNCENHIEQEVQTPTPVIEEIQETVENIEEKVSEKVIVEAKKEPTIEELREKVSKMTMQELYDSNTNFSIGQYEDDEEEGVIAEGEPDGKWYVYMSICQLGGCDFDGVPFDTEREALEEAVILTMQGKEPSCHACPECYSEYMRECE